MKMDQAGSSRLRRATVGDVARLAGVSPGTVSNTINGTRKVDETTRARVEAAIAELGYVPNIGARQFRTGRPSTIAVISSMPAAIAAGPSRLGFMMEIAASAAISALEQNVALVLVPPVPEPAKALRNVAFDGALLVEPAADDPFFDILEGRGVPVVGIGEPPASRAIPYVDLNYRETADLLVRHLHEAGAAHFPLMLGASARRSYEVMEEVYRTHAAVAGMTPTVLRVPEELGEEGAEKALTDLLAARPEIDGILVPVDTLASGVITALRAAGLDSVNGERVATRYDGIRAREERLTAVNLHLDVVAGLATRRLFEELTGVVASRIIAAPSPQLVLRR